MNLDSDFYFSLFAFYFLSSFPNIYSLFRAQAARFSGRDVFFRRVESEWRATTWAEFENEVEDFACALLGSGLTKCASVAILAGNIPEWTVVDIATIAAGGVGTGIYPTSSTEQCNFIINHSDARFLFVDTEAQLDKIANTNLPYPKLEKIIVLEEIGDESVELVDVAHRFSVDVKEVPVVGYRDFLAQGRAARGEFLQKIEEIGRSADPDDTAIMVYTSGTTGDPKGAMLSHRYILNSVESLRRSVPIFDSDVSLSYLPGCHVAERISGIYNRLSNGTPAYFVDDLSKLYEYMLDVKPTVFASLPRFFEKIHASVVARFGEDASAQQLNDAFGGRVRLLTSGGAPLPNEIADFFARRELPILQAYGLTENICVAFNTTEHLKFGTVGRPMPMCEVRIADDGEILVRSPMMFSGYYKQPDKTAEMFSHDGWLLTGDLGAIDEDGFLTITGRKKEIIVLSSGKNVAPAIVENLVKEDHLVSQCFLFGDGKSYCVALITVNAAEAAHFDGDIGARVAAAVEKANSRVSSPERIKNFKILDRDFSADELTPTMKMKRAVITENFRDDIEALYR